MIFSVKRMGMQGLQGGSDHLDRTCGVPARSAEYYRVVCQCAECTVHSMGQHREQSSYYCLAHSSCWRKTQGLCYYLANQLNVEDKWALA